ncbi:AAA family ATPase [Parasphingorhabdus halotolerans]|uniref:non-specific protein-tyrosine kinase n=1 Tax=Parasphingorhabdus halotolerans TaxID=2725558 RepID=A0A6H2DKH2_9SPHN|nr:AAA family ATPase [Parasphingorhabdus halotolerans]QJB68445.1 AAA family ATPase [Parasphingorhabdus halotolerans]
MNKYNPLNKSGSLLERAGEIYDYVPVRRDGVTPNYAPEILPSELHQQQMVPFARRSAPVYDGPRVIVDRDKLREAGFIVPDGPVTGISEEFRIIKRQLLLSAKGNSKRTPVPHGERILVGSAHPNEGKTFCALNLALSIAAEKDNEVLLVDADFAKPSILSSLGLEGSKGLMDALADPDLPVEDCIIHTDIPGLAILPAGDQTNNDTEFLASSRTEQVLNRLTQHNPTRIVIFDSPPVLSASPASVLATHVGQVLMIVKADETTETALRDALSLMAGCDHIQLLLNGTKFSPTGRRFGSYYGYGE